MNMMDYLGWRGDLSFFAVPFQEVDNLILTQLAYLDFTDMVPASQNDKGISLKDAAKRYSQANAAEPKETVPKHIRNCRELLYAMAETKRFGESLLSGFRHELSPERESQFTALCIRLPDGSRFISFGGTDSTVVGWKENFNMSFLSETPSQVKALNYLARAAASSQGVLRVGGHSKGGNHAVYAAMHLAPAYQRRLAAVYNNDGPGFTEQMISQRGYQAVDSRILTFLPESSVVGLLLEHDETYQVVQSSGVGLLQHDAFTWEVLGPRFVYADSLNKDSLLLDRVLKQWVGNMPDEKRRSFVNALFTILEKADFEATDSLSRLKLPQVLELIRAAEGLDWEEKRVLARTLLALLDAYMAIHAQDSTLYANIRAIYQRLQNLFRGMGAERIESGIQ